MPLSAPSSASVLTRPTTPCLADDVAGLERRGDEPVHRGDRDDAPVAAALQRRPGVLGEQERAREQDGQQRVPAVLGELRDRRDVLEAGVGDDGVQAPEALERRVDGAAVALAGGEVRRERLAGRVVVGLEVDGQHLKPSSTRRSAMARPMPLAAPVTMTPRVVLGAHGEITTRRGVTMTLRSPSEAMGTFIPVHGSAGLPIAAMCGVPPAHEPDDRRRGRDVERRGRRDGRLLERGASRRAHAR